MIKKVVLAVLLLVTLPTLETEAGLIFRQCYGLFPNARGVAGRVEARQSRRFNRRAYRRAMRCCG